MMGGSIGEQDIQGKFGHTYSIAVKSMSADRRFKLTQYRKEIGFIYLYHGLIMYEMMDPSTG